MDLQKKNAVDEKIKMCEIESCLPGLSASFMMGYFTA